MLWTTASRSKANDERETMDYGKAMTERAAAAVKELARRAETAREAVESAEERIKHAREDLKRKEEALARHRERATQKLTSSTSAFGEWRGRLRRLQRERETAQEARDLLVNEIGPKARDELAAAEKALRGALAAVAREVRDECEARMSEAFAKAVAEHDAFIEARGRLFADYGASAAGDDPPRVLSPRLEYKGIDKARLTDEVWRLTVTPPPSATKRPTLPPPKAATSSA